MSVARVYRVGVWSGFVGSALLLAVVLCWVDCFFYSWVLLGLLRFLRVTRNTPVLAMTLGKGLYAVC